MEPELRQKPVRYYEIDLLRFMAAMSVVLYHYTYRGYMHANYSPIAFPLLGSVTKYGYLGVELFFIISGYVVLLSAQGKTVKQFFVSRVTRLYPAFWVACTLTFLVKVLWGAGAMGETQMPALLHATAVQYAVNMTMLYDFLHVEVMDGAYWSLTVEITFYLLIAILIGFNLLRHLTLVLALWLAYTALPGAVREGVLLPALLFPAYAPYFAAGMLLYLMQQPEGRTWQRYGLLLMSYLLALRSSVGRAEGMAIFYHDAMSGKIVAGIITACFLVMALLAFRKIDLSRFTWLSVLGALTYPVYLIHSDIAFIAFHRVGLLFNKYVVLTVTLLVVLLIAYLIHILIEKRLSKPLGKQVAAWLAVIGR